MEAGHEVLGDGFLEVLDNSLFDIEVEVLVGAFVDVFVVQEGVVGLLRGILKWGWWCDNRFICECAGVFGSKDCNRVIKVNVVEGTEAFLPLFFGHDKEGKITIGVGDFGGQSGEVRNEFLSNFVDLRSGGELRDGVAGRTVREITVNGADIADDASHIVAVNCWMSNVGQIICVGTNVVRILL